MKQLISLFVSFVLCLIFVACGAQSYEQTTISKNENQGYASSKETEETLVASSMSAVSSQAETTSEYKEAVIQVPSELSVPLSENSSETVETSTPVDYDPILDFYDDVLKIMPPQYSAVEIQEMIDQNLSLDEVAEKISTPADLVQFLYRRGFRSSNGSITFDYGGYNWSVNRTAQTVFDQNAGNCGGGSNLVNYILKGDTEEQGYVELSANDWGHVFNYFKIDGIYHYLDLTTITRNGYNNEWHMLFPASSPQEWAEGYIERNRENDPPGTPNHFLFVYQYQYDGDHRPRGWDGSRTPMGKPHYNVLPEDMREEAVILYSDPSVSEPSFAPCISQDKWPDDINQMIREITLPAADDNSRNFGPKAGISIKEDSVQRNYVQVDGIIGHVSDYTFTVSGTGWKVWRDGDVLVSETVPGEYGSVNVIITADGVTGTLYLEKRAPKTEN